MPRGGSREGAGRKLGIPNKDRAELIAQVSATGETPLQYMIRVMQDKTAEHDRRDRMASAAAPYVHPKLLSTQHEGADGGAVKLHHVIEQVIVRSPNSGS